MSANRAAVFAVALLAGAGSAGPAAAQSAATPALQPARAPIDAAAVAAMARDVMAGLRRQEPDALAWQSRLDQWIDSSAWYVRDKIKRYKGEAPGDPRRRVALWPFWKDRDLAVDANFARALGEALHGGLVAAAGADFRIVTRDDLIRIEREIDEFNSLRMSQDKTNQLIREAGADILVVPQLVPGDAKSVLLSAAAHEVLTGTTLAAAPPRPLPYDFDTAASLGLEESLRRAAGYFLERRGDLRTLRPQGLRYQDSKVQTQFGSWFLARLATEVQRLRAAQGGFQTIAIADAVIADGRGLQLTERPVETLIAQDAPGDYVLKGVYWDLGESLDLQLTLTNAKGESTVWQGYVRKASLPAELRAGLKPRPGDERDEVRPGAIGFAIASERGEDPVYRIGQDFVMLVQASRDSYLYCFYRQSDGKLMKIFPNRFHRSSRLVGQRTQAIPDRAMRFDWKIAEPPGADQVKCFALDRDVDARLPKPIRDTDFEALPYKSFAEINAVFRKLGQVALAEAAMVITVER